MKSAQCLCVVCIANTRRRSACRVGPGPVLREGLLPQHLQVREVPRHHPRKTRPSRGGAPRRRPPLDGVPHAGGRVRAAEQRAPRRGLRRARLERARVFAQPRVAVQPPQRAPPEEEPDPRAPAAAAAVAARGAARAALRAVAARAALLAAPLRGAAVAARRAAHADSAAVLLLPPVAPAPPMMRRRELAPTFTPLLSARPRPAAGGGATWWRASRARLGGDGAHTPQCNPIN